MSFWALSEKIGSKRLRNPNWTDDEIYRFLELLQENEVLQYMKDNRTRQVFHYISAKLTEEGREKTPLQCKVKLKNLKFHWKSVLERVPFLEKANLENEVDMVKLIQECEKNGISSFNVRHVRMLKRFLDSLNALKNGFVKNRTFHQIHQKPPISFIDVNSITQNGIESTGENLVQDEYNESNHIVIKTEEADIEEVEVLDVSGEPTDLENYETKNIPGEKYITSNEKCNIHLEEYFSRRESLEKEESMSRLQIELSDKFLTYQREASQRTLNFEQEQLLMEQNFLEKWRLSQNTLLEQWREQQQQLMNRWRKEQRDHDEKLLGIFTNFINQSNNMKNNN